MPQDYDVVTLTHHQAAMFVATPVLKVAPTRAFRSSESLPKLYIRSFALTFGGTGLWEGGWNPEVEHPHGLSVSAMMEKTPNRNLIPNQSIVYGELGTELAVGDWVFFRPLQSDLMVQFDRIRLVRDRKIVDETWKPFPNRL
jgi:D-serine deaminase-like pyridoxal phosphate-dependent protein